MLIGRHGERQTIAAVVAGARVGQSGVLVLTGEAGIGKSSLLTDAVEGCAGMNLLSAAGIRSERELSFGGLHQLLTPALRLLEKIPRPQADALSVALALAPGRGVDRFAVGAATLSLLCRYAEDRPVLVVIDDAHDLDRPSVEALLFAARRLTADPVALLVAHRAGETTLFAEAQLPTLTVGGLDVRSAGELLSTGEPVPVGSELANRLHRATGGNPLALLELAGRLASLERSSPEVPVPVPESIRQEYARRIGRLSDDTRAVLLLAAVADGELTVLARACRSLDRPMQALVQAEEADLVRVGPERVTFRHPLVRAAVYGSATPEARRASHRCIAAALPESAVERRGWQRSEGCVGPDDEVAELMDRIGAA
ncbi:MAG TPA: AAA family ATPase, partial [Candidatus Nanopelagicales bacterium]|nr:AAA family ATPase [Candidatus Nanopelagicales bacterium]